MAAAPISSAVLQAISFVTIFSFAAAISPSHIEHAHNREHFQRVGRELVGKGSTMGTPQPPTWYQGIRGGIATFDITHFGAKGDGNSDDTDAIIKAFASACADRHNNEAWARQHPAEVLVPAGRTFVIRQFIAHPKAKNVCFYVGFRIEGTLKGQRGTWGYNKGAMRGYINFGAMKYNWVIGSGAIDFNGMDWWSKPGQGPKGLCMLRCYNTYVSGISILNSGASSFVYDMGGNLVFELVTISTPGDSPNTDGVHLARCDDTWIRNSYIGSGDDCVVWQTACNRGVADNVYCGPGSHGLSWGSMGRFGTTCMQDFKVSNIVFDRSVNGLHPKSFANGNGALYNLQAKGLTMIDVKKPIYFDAGYAKSKGNKAVAMYMSTIQDVTGTSSGKEGIIVKCQQDTPCGVTLKNINLKPSKGNKAKTLSPLCSNAHGAFMNVVPSLMNCMNTGMPPNMGGNNAMAKMCKFSMNTFFNKV